MRAARWHPAFTLLELLIVLVITAMLASMAMVRFGHSEMRQRADAAARRIVADLTLARKLADHGSRATAVRFDVGADSYHLAGVEDADHAGQDYAVCLASEPYRVRLVSADFDGATSIAFDAFGLPPGTVNLDGTVVIRAGVEQRTITLNRETGEARLQ